MIPYARQHINEADIDAVIEVLNADYLTQGPKVPEFEQALAAYCRVPHAVACNSATSALHLACLALGLGPGDILWTSPITFVASANCGRYCGAEVDFVDIDPRSYNLDVAALEEKLRLAERRGRLPKVVVAVHFAGQSCDMRAIAGLARRYGFRVIEDASHALGGTYRGEPVGCCRYADIAVFSFHPVKMITSGEGGMAVSRDPELLRRMRRLRGHGITRDAAEMSEPPPGDWYYQQLELGYNYRMSDIHAALGLSQLRRLPQFVQMRTRLARRYREQLSDLPLILPWQAEWQSSAWHLYVVQVSDEAGIDRKTLFAALRQRGIGVQVHYIPVHTQPYYQRLGFRPGQFPRAEAYYRRALTLPLYPGINPELQDRVIEQLRELLA